MGNVASRDIYDKSGPKTGSGLDTLAKNQGAMREGIGMLPPKDVTIKDGAITAFEEAALVVDTEGGAPADDLYVISDMISSTEKLHPGMLITIKAKDPARVVTVKNSVSPNGINIADGKDIVLSPYWELTLRLVGGKWYEVRGRSSALAEGAQSTANTAKSVTDTVTTIPTAGAVPKADISGKIQAGWLYSDDSKLDKDMGNRPSNLPYITKSWKSSDSSSWYRKWSDGFIEQGGYLGVTATNPVTVTFPAPFVTAVYPAVVYSFRSEPTNGHPQITNRTTTGMTFIKTGDAADTSWFAAGY